MALFTFSLFQIERAWIGKTWETRTGTAGRGRLYFFPIFFQAPVLCPLSLPEFERVPPSSLSAKSTMSFASGKFPKILQFHSIPRIRRSKAKRITFNWSASSACPVLFFSSVLLLVPGGEVYFTCLQVLVRVSNLPFGKGEWIGHTLYGISHRRTARL